MTLELDIDDTLKFDGDGNLSLNVSTESKGSVSFKDDGLYVAAPPGKDGTGGEGYQGSAYDAEGLRFGSKSPYGLKTDPAIASPLMFTCTNIIHRVFESSTEDGSKLINFRDAVDCTLCGDMFRVKQESGKYKYFLIVETFFNSRTVQCGNLIKQSVFLGEW